MGEACFEELAFAPPAAWSPRTVVEYNAPPGPYAYPPCVIVIREGMRDEDSLTVLVDRQASAVGELPGGRVVRRTDLRVDGFLAMELAYEWSSAGILIEQVTTLVETSGEGRRAITSFTTICARSDASILAMTFAALLESIRIGGRPISAIVPAPDSAPTLPTFNPAHYSTSPSYGEETIPIAPPVAIPPPALVMPAPSAPTIPATLDMHPPSSRKDVAPVSIPPTIDMLPPPVREVPMPGQRRRNRDR